MDIIERFTPVLSLNGLRERFTDFAKNISTVIGIIRVDPCSQNGRSRQRLRCICRKDPEQSVKIIPRTRAIDAVYKDNFSGRYSGVDNRSVVNRDYIPLTYSVINLLRVEQSYVSPPRLRPSATMPCRLLRR